jgi:hypothetical protein
MPIAIMGVVAALGESIAIAVCAAGETRFTDSSAPDSFWIVRRGIPRVSLSWIAGAGTGEAAEAVVVTGREALAEERGSARYDRRPGTFIGVAVDVATPVIEGTIPARVGFAAFTAFISREHMPVVDRAGGGRIARTRQSRRRSRRAKRARTRIGRVR